ncbi:MAG: hypothetical protein II703_05970, partial [Ruminococcus sp.]|nr:hypothetical protein [Ruminococcus sp.]
NVKIKSIQDYSAQFVSLLKSRGIRTDVAADTHGKLLDAAKMRAEEYTYYPKDSHTRPAARAVGGSRHYSTVFSNVGIKAYLLKRDYASVENLCNGWGGEDESVHGKPEWALEKWLASGTHKGNILNTKIKKISVVCVTTEETRSGYTVTGHYWVMLGFSNDIA